MWNSWVVKIIDCNSNIAYTERDLCMLEKWVGWLRDCQILCC
jgi:hypothetical protein